MAVKPAASVAVKVTVTEPGTTVAVASGDCVTVTVVQLSAAVARPVKSPSRPVHGAVSVTVCVEAAVIVGTVVSLTTSVATHVVVLPAASIAVSVTVVVPTETVAPAAGDCVKDVTPQLSVAVEPATKFGTR